MTLVIGKIEELRAAEIGRIIQLTNQRGELFARQYIADDIVKLRQMIADLESRLSSARDEALEETKRALLKARADHSHVHDHYWLENTIDCLKPKKGE